MPFNIFMQELYLIHLDSARSRDLDLKKISLSLIGKVLSIESNFEKITLLVEELNNIKLRKVFTEKNILEYKKYKTCNQKLISLSYYELKTMFDFKMKYIDLEIFTEKKIKNSESEVDKEKIRKDAFNKYKIIFQDMIFKKISNDIRKNNKETKIEDLENNLFWFDLYFPDYDGKKDFFEGDLKVNEAIKLFLNKPIELSITQLSNLNNYYDFELNSTSYEYKISKNVITNNRTEKLKLLIKINDLI